jgi:glutaredoxin
VTAVTLYSKPNCHLCDLAYQLLTDLDLTVSVVDIQSNPVLMEKYHSTIPVVLFSNTAALSWPFDIEAIQSLLNQL